MGVGRSWAGGAAAMSVALLVGGCSGGSGSQAGSPAASSSSRESEVVASSAAAPTGETGSSPVSSSASTSATSSTGSSGTAAGAVGVPEAARQHTAAGARAFANYYVGLINETGEHPKSGVLDVLSASSCKTCENHIKTVDNNVKNSRKFDGLEFVILRTFHTAESTVFVVVEAPAVRIVDSTGSVVQTFPKEDNYAMVFDLNWSSTRGWSVATIKYDSSTTK